VDLHEQVINEKSKSNGNIKVYFTRIATRYVFVFDPDQIIPDPKNITAKIPYPIF